MLPFVQSYDSTTFSRLNMIHLLSMAMDSVLHWLHMNERIHFKRSLIASGKLAVFHDQ